MKRAWIVAAVAAAAVVVAAAGGRSATAAGLCAYPVTLPGAAGPITAVGTTAVATFTVVSTPCTVNLISYQSRISGRIPVDSASHIYTTIGPSTLQVRLACNTDNQIELFIGAPPATADTDIGAAAFTPTCLGGGAFTQGYWKNHPSSWPVPSVLVGGSSFTVAQGVAALTTPPKGGDASVILGHQLIAAELNVAGGAASSCIATTIVSANALLATHPFGSNLSSSSPDGQLATQLASTLDAYNSGKLCAASGE